MSPQIYKFAAVLAFVMVVGLSGCQAGRGVQPGAYQQQGVYQQPGAYQQQGGYQQTGMASRQPTVGSQLGQRAGNIAVNRLINAGITRAISAF